MKLMKNEKNNTKLKASKEKKAGLLAEARLYFISLLCAYTYAVFDV